jgi:hypothetical protein
MNFYFLSEAVSVSNGVLLFLNKAILGINSFYMTNLERFCLMACSSSLDDSSPSARHVFVVASSSGLRGRRRTYLTILKRAWSANSKMVRYEQATKVKHKKQRFNF